MQESWPYRVDLHVFARSFEVRSKKQLWRDDSLSKAEKMLFVGFFFVRKLIECQRVTDRCARSSTTISRAAIQRKREVSAFKRDDLLKDLNRAEWIEQKVDVRQLADKIVHTWWIIPFLGERSGLGGFISTTDRQRNTELWLLPISSIVEVFDRFANSTVQRLRMARDENGRLSYWRAE